MTLSGAGLGRGKARLSLPVLALPGSRCLRCGVEGNGDDGLGNRLTGPHAHDGQTALGHGNRVIGSDPGLTGLPGLELVYSPKVTSSGLAAAGICWPTEQVFVFLASAAAGGDHKNADWGKRESTFSIFCGKIKKSNSAGR